MSISFNKVHLTGREIEYLSEVCRRGHLSGDGHYTKLCNKWLEDNVNCIKALLTHSCTAALEMAAMLADIQVGDEVIMPSYTFVSTANAFVLRGAIPVFVDIRPDTLNLDEKKIEEAITKKTKAIVVVHYAGVSCEMDSILNLAKKYSLFVIEDAAQGLMATYKGRALGAIGDIGAFSFHETKNIVSGEGGALLLNRPDLVGRAEIIREKGTDRSRFFRGEVDKYTWQEAGSSFLPGELIAAFLWAQLEVASSITAGRMQIWNRYHSMLERYEAEGLLRRPTIPSDCVHNAHLYYVLFESHVDRHAVLDELKRNGIGATFHYVPLHSSPAGKKFGRVGGNMDVSDSLPGQLIRLPLWVGLPPEQQDFIIEKLFSVASRVR